MARDNELSIWTVYKDPADYPGKYVARRFLITGGGSHATPEVVINDSLEVIQGVMTDRGLTKLPRSPGDERQIVESWI